MYTEKELLVLTKYIFLNYNFKIEKKMIISNNVFFLYVMKYYL